MANSQAQGLSAVSHQPQHGYAEITDPMDPIKIVLLRLDAGTLGIVQAADLILQELKKRKMSYLMKIHSRQIGFDPSNRDDTGGNAQEVHLLAEDIAHLGFSWQECSHALCIEVVPGDKTVEIFNKLLSEGALMPLAPVEPDSIIFGSLAAGHTNQCLRCIDSGVASCSDVLSVDGYMSVEHLRKRDKEFARAVDEGLPWEVLRWPVRLQYPKILVILQSARNTAGHVQRKVTEV
jgi:hypothetical protein